MTYVSAVGSMQIAIGNHTLVVKPTDENMRQATGMLLNQIQMLRAVFEDLYGVDPATLSSSMIVKIAQDFANDTGEKR